MPGGHSAVLFIQFGIIPVAVSIAAGLLSEIFLQGCRQVNAGLIGQADQYKKHVGHFIGQVGRLVGFLCRLDRKSVV